MSKPTAEQWFDQLNELLAIAPNADDLPEGREREVYRHTIMALLTHLLEAAPELFEAKYTELFAEAQRARKQPQ